MKVIGTAGHIDHGKSTLVHRLTGIDPDRLEEEKRRGMTIDLGFAWLALPSGAEVSIVDVPGHERFIKNMVAGSGGVDVALLVVAADESIMPQTREHLDILHLLDIRRGVVALTKRDLVDEEWLELVTEEVAEALRGTVLEGSPIVPVSARSGQGIDSLLAEMDRAVESVDVRPDHGFPYLPVDRSFTVAGFGTVITGTLHGGVLRSGTEAEVVPAGLRVRARGLQSHQQPVEMAFPGSRVAVNLSGVSRHQVRRGDVLAPTGSIVPIKRFDAWLSVLSDVPFPLRHDLEVALHVGSAERPARLFLLDSAELRAGESGWVQLRTDEPIAAVRGQRFIIRLPAPARTVAGGQIVDVAPRQRRQPEERVARLTGLRSPDLMVAALATLVGERRRSAAQVARTLAVSSERADELLDSLATLGSAVKLGASYLHTDVWADLEARTRTVLDAFHSSQPLARGMGREELRSRLVIPKSDWVYVVRRLEERGGVAERAGLLSLPEHVGGLGSRRAEADRVLRALLDDPFSPPSGEDLISRAQAGGDVLQAMVEAGEIVRLGEGLYYERQAYLRAVSRILDLMRSEGEISVAQVRDGLDTSRKYALALLEYLDGEKITRRVGDVRVAGARAEVCV
ncbi:MAG: selenocysteine-specific translation elongation factor [Chloroflexota bacterium]|nr:selenocysteine-specific translation elongation factor [Chloroflexota bacterium]